SRRRDDRGCTWRAGARRKLDREPPTPRPWEEACRRPRQLRAPPVGLRDRRERPARRRVGRTGSHDEPRKPWGHWRAAVRSPLLGGPAGRHGGRRQAGGVVRGGPPVRRTRGPGAAWIHGDGSERGSPRRDLPEVG